MARTPIVVGNWKLNKTVAEGLELVTSLKNSLAAVRGVDVGVAPVFTALHAIAKRLDGTNIGVSGQDCYWQDRGAFTGEVAPSMLTDVGCRYCILGHSERRHVFGEKDSEVADKVRAVLDAGLVPILCVGETEGERDSGQTESRVAAQIDAGLSKVSAEDMEKVVIAYEPVWAIGTGRTATPMQAQEVHAAIRSQLGAKFGAVSGNVRIQYGGSVKPGNAAELMAQPDIDGALVGGASLKSDDFVAIVKAARG